jgi:hypothetical protein
MAREVTSDKLSRFLGGVRLGVDGDQASIGVEAGFPACS